MSIDIVPMLLAQPLQVLVKDMSTGVCGGGGGPPGRCKGGWGGVGGGWGGGAVAGEQGRCTGGSGRSWGSTAPARCCHAPGHRMLRLHGMGRVRRSERQQPRRTRCEVIMSVVKLVRPVPLPSCDQVNSWSACSSGTRRCWRRGSRGMQPQLPTRCAPHAMPGAARGEGHCTTAQPAELVRQIKSRQLAASTLPAASHHTRAPCPLATMCWLLPTPHRLAGQQQADQLPVGQQGRDQHQQQLGEADGQPEVMGRHTASCTAFGGQPWGERCSGVFAYRRRPADVISVPQRSAPAPPLPGLPGLPGC
jgi:hypothetical protein